MYEVQPAVKDCYRKHHQPGTALVRCTIDPAGTIGQAQVLGTLAGTPTGDCTAEAVRTAHFPAFTGAVMSIIYPFVLP